MSRTKRYHGQRGVAAVEFAILLPIFVILLSGALFIGRAFWHYTVVQKAAHDVALYVSTISESEIRSPTSLAAALDVGNQIALAELSDINSGITPSSIGVLCDGIPCDGLSTPKTVRVIIRVLVTDPFFGIAFAGDGMLLSGDVTMVYLGSN